MDLINIMASAADGTGICDPDTGLLSIFGFIGNIITIIKIAVPIILILMGSIDLTKAVMASKDDEIKKAQSTLLKRAIVGVIIFFIPSIVTLLMSMLNQSTDTQCLKCITSPNNAECKVDV